jgi:hypothetical protein
MMPSAVSDAVARTRQLDLRREVVQQCLVALAGGAGRRRHQPPWPACHGAGRRGGGLRPQASPATAYRRHAGIGMTPVTGAQGRRLARLERAVLAHLDTIDAAVLLMTGTPQRAEDLVGSRPKPGARTIPGGARGEPGGEPAVRLRDQKALRDFSAEVRIAVYLASVENCSNTRSRTSSDKPRPRLVAQ